MEGLYALAEGKSVLLPAFDSFDQPADDGGGGDFLLDS
jgi:hypothetical protein